MTHLLMCVSSCGLSGICWASLDADICASAATRTTLLSMFISGLQCDSEDVAMHWWFQAQSATVTVFTSYTLSTQLHWHYPGLVSTLVQVGPSDMIVLLTREILHTASNQLSKGPGAGDHTHWQCSYLLEQIVWLHRRHRLSFTHHQLPWELLLYNIWTKLLSVTCSLPCHTAIRLVAQTYPNVAMWAANTIN